MSRIKQYEYLVIHGSATSPTMDIGAKEIREWHKSKGWKDIGYHYVIRRNGDLEYGRELNITGAHVKGFNSRSIGICMVGGVDPILDEAANNYTPAQFHTLGKLISIITILIPDIEVVGHRELPGTNTVCPCFNVNKWKVNYDGE